MMKHVRFRSLVPVPAADLFAWHASDGAFERLVPPWQNVEVVSRSGSIRDGDELTMKINLGPVSTTWLALHDSYVDGKQFRDTQVAGPFCVWKHTHRVHEETSRSSILDDDIEFEVPFDRVASPFIGHIVHKEIRKMFRFRHLRTRLDLHHHDQNRERPRLDFAVVGSHPLAGQLRAFLTGGGHNEAEVSKASTLIDLRQISKAGGSALAVAGEQHLIALHKGQHQHTTSLGRTKQTVIAVPPRVIGPSFAGARLFDVVPGIRSSFDRTDQEWIAEDDLIWLVHFLAMNPELTPHDFSNTFTTQNAAKRFLGGYL
jgi:ligand-binding SRPBCC domain-containing protein